MPGQSVIRKDQRQDDLFFLHFNQDPGTTQRFYLGVAWKDMWLDHASARWVAASTSLSVTADTMNLAKVADATAFATNTDLTGALSVLTAANTVVNFVVTTTANFVAEGEAIILEFGAAPASGMGILSITAQFTTRRL